MTTATCHTVTERKHAVTFKGTPMTLLGSQLAAGAKAPEFQVTAQDLTSVSLADLLGKTTLINVVTSLDTSICDAQTRRFNEEASRLPNVQILTVSMDLPFAQKRWCGAAGITNVKVVSDHRAGSFGKAFGVQIKELRLLARAIFLVDAQGTLRYAEYVPEVATHPNYDAALAATRQIAK